MSKAQEQAQLFVNTCNEYGFSFSCTDSVVTITKTFTPGDKDAYTHSDCFGEMILGLAPLKGGSVWGTDGGSVGGHVGLTNGYYKLNKAGSGKRFIAALKKYI